ncbi:hypothetical protein BCF74_12638 [Knoellia remsis]|uniref:Uncharacterized protein n=1 Tax=Knoellia remsis TaxID=407159 RepID=A0A2T0U7Y5_9MICO|nr:hypothetical protein [Knoellia remsis]PRY54024.1 hypothetical protein BCF74_12638 [Knoellia remsis]
MTTPSLGSDVDLRSALRTALTQAMRSRDRAAAAALRSAIAALDNAEAIPVGAAPATQASPIAGSAVGVGATEAERRTLTHNDQLDIVETEVQDLRNAADELIDTGHEDRAAELLHGADTLLDVLRST